MLTSIANWNEEEQGARGKRVMRAWSGVDGPKVVASSPGLTHSFHNPVEYGVQDPKLKEDDQNRKM